MIKKTILMGLALMAASFGAQADHLTILTANDTHSCIVPNQKNLGGIMRQKVVMDSVRAADKNVLAIHAGDAVQGTVFFSMFKGDVEYAAMDSLGYDIIILGNHEFDNGVESIEKYYGSIKAEKTTANYDMSETGLDGMFKPYILKTFGGKKVAFFGINLEPKGMIADKSIGGVRYVDGVKVALSMSRHLKETGIADYVVMVSHIGHTSRPGGLSDVEIVKQSKYIDLVIGGHSHTLVDPSNKSARNPHLVKNAEGKEIAICQNGGQGEQLGKIDFDLETGKVVYSHIKIDSKYDERANAQYPEMKAWLAPYIDAVNKKMTTRIATSTMQMGSSSHALGNWVCDAVVEIGKQLYGEEVQFSLMNRGGIRQPMPKGDVTEGDIESMLPFDNRLVVIKIKGEDLMRVFQALASRGGDAVSSAVDVVFDSEGKVVTAKIAGKKIKNDAEYTLITIDYLANGGSRMGDLKRGKTLFVDTVPYGQHVIDYVKQQDAKGAKIKSDDKRRMCSERANN